MVQGNVTPASVFPFAANGLVLATWDPLFSVVSVDVRATDGSTDAWIG